MNIRFMNNKLFLILKTIVLFPVLPFVVFFRALKSREKVSKKILLFLWILLVLAPLWGAIYTGVFLSAGKILGLTTVAVPIAGTGSMYPTFPKIASKNLKDQKKQTVARPRMYPYPGGFVFGKKRYFGRVISRGDIVVFENKITQKIEEERYGEASGFVKRVIAVAGDTIEVRDGFIYLNGTPLPEPYIARARSTFGGTSIPECAKLTVSSGKYVVMGDNRTASEDSRHEIGMIDKRDIHYLLPVASQRGVWDRNWRDTANDLEESSKLKINTANYLKLLNEHRKVAGKKPLTYNARLEGAARLRGNTILRTNDFSFEATRSGYTMQRAMRDAGYSNVIAGESFSQGFFEAEEFIENIFEFQKSSDFVLNPDYEEVGLAQVEGLVNGCPTQVVVAHFGGYKPPNYDKKVVDSWRKLVNDLNNIRGSWERLKEEGEFYENNKAQIDRINEIIAVRIDRASRLASRMEANQWLTTLEEQFAKEDEALGEEQIRIAEELIRKSQ